MNTERPISTYKDVKYHEVDQSGWPVVSREKYADMLTQVAGLLATGHYSNPEDVESDTISVISQRDYVGNYQPVVVAASSWVG